MSAVVRVAVGVLRDHRGRVLIALRPSHKHQGDLWEFPGGKIEAGESAESALRRELSEELGVIVRHSVPLVNVPFSYSDKEVQLEVREVLSFDGEPRGNEGQVVRWVELHELDNYRFPAANASIIKAILLPDLVCVTGQYADSGDFKFRLERAIARGAGMVVFRPVDGEYSPGLVRVAAEICAQVRVPLVLNSAVDSDLWRYADGIHLRADHARDYMERPVEATKWLGASCHTSEEAEHAIELGVDYLFLSPVLPTASHPNSRILGWDGFAAIAGEIDVPIYALGGMRSTHLLEAKQVGAKGIASISGLWK